MSKYRSDDENVNVVNPAAGEDEAISAVPTTDPDMPPASIPVPVNPVDSTRDSNADSTVPVQRFRFRSENEEVAPAAPTENPVAPIDAPAPPGSDAAPANAPATPEVTPADVQAPAPMAEPQPDAEVAPATDTTNVAPNTENIPNEAGTDEVGAVEPNGATPPSEVTPPADENAGNNGASMRFRQEGEEISVVATPDPRTPAETESAECPETGDECVDKNIKEPINPVIEQEDPVTGDAFEDGDLADGDLGSTPPDTSADAPQEETIHKDITYVTPDEAQDGDELGDGDISPIAEMNQFMRMEDEAGVEAGDQDVNATVNVNVRKDDGDEHSDDSADAGADVADNGDQKNDESASPEQRFGFRQDGEMLPPPPASVEFDVKSLRDAPEKKSQDNGIDDNTASVPDQNTGSSPASGDPAQLFSQWMQEGGEWL